MGYLGFPFVKVLHLEAEEVAGGSEGEACAGGIIPEQRDAKTAFEYLRGNVVLPHVAERIGNGEYCLDFVIGLCKALEEYKRITDGGNKL